MGLKDRGQGGQAMRQGGERGGCCTSPGKMTKRGGGWGGQERGGLQGAAEIKEETEFHRAWYPKGIDVEDQKGLRSAASLA